MTLKMDIKKFLKLIGADTRQAVVGYVVVAILVLVGGTILSLSKTVLDFVIQIINISTPLWATITLIFLFGLYTYLKVHKAIKNSEQAPLIEEKLREEFGVYWNDQNKLRCLYCKYPLHPSSNRHDASIFFCSNCDRKYSLRDKNGNHLNEAQAIELLKNC